MDQVWYELLKTYGIGGLILVFTGWLLVTLVRHFLEKDNKKDEQILEMTRAKDEQILQVSTKFSEALDRNTRALNELTQSEIKLTNAADNIVKGFDRAAAQNREEHGEILEFIRDTRRMN